MTTDPISALAESISYTHGGVTRAVGAVVIVGNVLSPSAGSNAASENGDRFSLVIPCAAWPFDDAPALGDTASTADYPSLRVKQVTRGGGVFTVRCSAHMRGGK